MMRAVSPEEKSSRNPAASQLGRPLFGHADPAAHFLGGTASSNLSFASVDPAVISSGTITALPCVGGKTKRSGDSNRARTPRALAQSRTIGVDAS